MCPCCGTKTTRFNTNCTPCFAASLAHISPYDCTHRDGQVPDCDHGYRITDSCPVCD